LYLLGSADEAMQAEVNSAVDIGGGGYSDNHGELKISVCQAI
jgi:hypothetical protein